MTEQEDYPEEYTRGYVTFFGRRFIVNPHVLIPRLETEVLIKRARKMLQHISVSAGFSSMQVQNGESEGGKLFESDESKKEMSKANEFLPPSGPFASFQSGKEESNHILTIDIGCGSGIIGTSLGDTSTEILFLDISEEALKVTRKNFETNFPTKKANFMVSDLLSYFLEDSTSLPPNKNHLLILANLPYIKEDDWENMSADTHYEPKLALFGGEKTGFEMYERLFGEIEILNKLLSHTKIILLCEFGFDQREIAENILQRYPNWQYTFFTDYAGIERFVEVYIEG